MAQIGQVIPRIAKASGALPSTVDRMMRPLRAAELVPMGEKGRNPRTGHFEKSHLANLILSFGGQQPIDAAEAALALREYRYHFTSADPDGHTVIPPSEHPGTRVPNFDNLNLGELIEALLDVVAERISAGHPVTAFPLPRAIRLEPVKRRAVVYWRVPEKMFAWQADVYMAPPAAEPAAPEDLDSLVELARIGVSREVSIAPSVLMAAGELWADTLARRGSLLLPPPTTPSATTAGANIETPEPHHRAPASDTHNQPREPRATGHAHTPETKRVCLNYQGHSGSRGPFHPLEEPRSHEARP
jgi:hypothetical protein